MLIVIATPIGNLQDLSPHAQSALADSDIVLCEDTRHTLKLYRAFGLEVPNLVSLHGHNEKSKVPWVLEQLKSGLKVALVSDAGTPLISDPGQGLVQAVHQEGLPISAVPGPSAVITAISVAGFPPPFQFVGFPPRKQGALIEFLKSNSLYSGATVLYEAGNRCSALFSVLVSLFPEREACLCRELTKRYEEIKRGPLKDWEVENYKGEVVVVLGPGKPIIEEAVSATRLKGVAKQLAKIWKMRSSEAYDILIKIKPQKDESTEN